MMHSTLAAPLAKSAPPITNRAPPVALLGIPFDNLTLAAAVEKIHTMIAARTPHHVVTANVDFLVQAGRDVELRRILLNADLVLCDGTPLVWASRWLGNPLPERVAGADLVPELIRSAAQRGDKIYFLGATPEANARAVSNVRQQFPGLVVAGHAPPFHSLSALGQDEIISRIRQARPDMLFVAFGCPKAEKWIAKHLAALNVPVVIGVGATIDFLAGRVRRAPRWMQRCGAEWLFRLSQEPRRLFRRYASDLSFFSWNLARQIQLQRPGPAATDPGEPQAGFDPPSFDAQPAWQRIRLPPCLDVQAVRGGVEVWQEVGSQPCVLDLSAVRFIDSTGIALLLELRRKLGSAGKHLVLLAPNRTVTRALELMRVQEFFVIASRATPAECFASAPTRSCPTATL